MVDRFPLQFLLVTWAGWVNRRQLDVIDYLRTENQILKAQVGRRHLRLSPDQRRRLAAKGLLSRAARAAGGGSRPE